MHTSIKFNSSIFTLLLLALSFSSKTVFITCNQVVDQWQRVQQQQQSHLNQSFPSSGTITSVGDVGPKQEGKAGLGPKGPKKFRLLDRASTSSGSASRHEEHVTTTEENHPPAALPNSSATITTTKEVLPIHVHGTDPFYRVGTTDDDLISSMRVTDLHSSPMLPSSPAYMDKQTPTYPTTPISTSDASSSSLPILMYTNSSINAKQYSPKQSTTSTSRRPPLDYITVPDVHTQRYRVISGRTNVLLTDAPNKSSAAPPPPSSNQSSTIKAVSSTVQFSYPAPPPLLLYSIRFEIRSFDLMASMANKQYNDHAESNSALVDQHRLRNSPSKTLIAGLKNAICLDFYYSPAESFIFWIDVIEEKIFRGSISNGLITNVNMIIQGGLSSAEGLAVDWVAKNIYWVESTLDHIEVASMNGSSRRTLIAGDMESPRAISIDPRYGLLFWTDWDKKSPRIERASMSGQNRKTIVDIKEVNGGWPNGLTLDYEALRIYWIDANSDSIHVVDYEGNNPRALLRKIKSLGHPFAITLFENNLYWTDWKTNFISMANKIDGSEPRAQIQRHQTRLFDIKVFHPSRQPRVEDSVNPCAVNNGNCSHLCLLDLNQTRVCECPHLMRLAADNLTCEIYEKVLLIGKSNEIRAVDLMKPLHYIMAPITVPRVFNPRQFDYDSNSRSIFWADSSTNEVKRASLTGSNIETIIDVIIENPNGLSLDWISGNIYVTSASSNTKTGKIFISNLRGEFISILMDHHKGIIAPKSIAVHPLLGLLFCIDENEQGEPLIFMASMDGQNKSIITARHIDPTLSNPVSLALDLEADRVYWVNTASFKHDHAASQQYATIQYYDITRNRIITLYNEAELPPEQWIQPGVLCVDGDYLIISSRAPSDNLIRASKDNLTERFIYKTPTLDHVMALKVYNASSQAGVNACKVNNGGCSQLCIPTSSSSRVCKCTMGYSIDTWKGTECWGKSMFLIYSSNQGMKGISLEPNSSIDEYHLPPIYRAFRASSIDYVYRDNLIYWVDNEEGSITRINRDTTNHQVVIQGLEAEQYIGIDWVAGNIYWLDPYYDVIEVARLNGSSRYVIVSGDIDKANGIRVNPLKGYIVWSDIGSMPKIERARLDGSDRKTLVNTGLLHIDELSIDYADDFIYWLDSTLSIIERIKADGTSRKIVYNGQLNGRGPQEHLIAMAVFGQHLYVADALLDGSIMRLHKGDGSLGFDIIQNNLGDNIKDIAIFAPQSIPSAYQNPCVKDNGGCQDLCLFLGEPGKKRCICSHGRLKPDALTCEPHDKFLMFSKLSQIDSLHMEDDESHDNSPYPPITIESKSHIISLTIDYGAKRVIYSEMTQDQICSVFFNGTDRRVLVEKQSMVEGIAFEENQLYWTSIQDNSISRLNISSSGVLAKECNDAKCKPATVEKLVKLGTDDKPRGIALDSCSAYIYWTNWNNEASIQRASPVTGYKIESIIKTNIKVPNGIAIDQKRRKLYWCDARLDKIETCDMDGSNRIILINAMPQHPFALAVWKNYIFWTDWLARGVFRADKYTGQHAMQIKKIAQRPMGIAVAASDTYTCPVDVCQKNNGGCPPDHVCVSRELDSGESHISCLGDKLLQPKRLKSVNYTPHLPITCQGTPNVTKCREYHAILQDQYEQFRMPKTAEAPNKTKFPSADEQRESPSSTMNPVITYQTPTTMSVTSRSSLSLPDSNHSRSISTPTMLPVSSSSSPSEAIAVSSQKATTTQAIISTSGPFSDLLPTRNTSNTSTMSSSSPQPCQVTPAPSLQTTTTDAYGHECKNPTDFRCYLSEKLFCIEGLKRCDGSYDCPNKEDENDCYLASRGQYSFKHETNWPKFVTVILVILAAALAALFLVFGKRSRRRWFVGSYNGFSHSKMFEDNGTNIEISNPMFDEDDSVNLVNCPFSIDLNERTTNFSNPLYERQVLLVNDKNPTPK